ncbi:MAG: acyl-CoA dehydrogenase family protein [Thermodesulfobacteriota bacterium]
MDYLKTLPGDDVRQIMWRFADRFDLQMAIQTARSIARGVVARMVADGVRNTHDWNDRKAELLKAFDESGLTSIYMDPRHGGFIEGPKNLALSLVAFELSWVDGGAATSSLANCLGLAPIHEKGTPEQRDAYMGACSPSSCPDGATKHAAFALTEPLPYVGVDTGVLAGKLRVAEWEEGKEPVLQVEKRGRFITGMDFANIVTAAVDTDDPRIKTSCMVILEDGDPGVFDRGAPTKKLVHQLSSTRDPVFSLKIPASRIIGGYTVQDGVIVPNYSHAEIIGAVFHRTRIPVGLMSSAKLLSAVEPIIRYHRQRFRGGKAEPGTPRYEQGIQMNEDAMLRLAEVWATGEAASSLGFAAARLADRFDPVEREKDRLFAEQGVTGPRKQMAELKKVADRTVEYLDLAAEPDKNPARLAELETDTLVQYSWMDALANVLIPACKLWNTGYGATAMREAVSLVGGYGITEDCPGFLCQKWADAQLEATYEGPEVVQRRHLGATMTNPLFLHQIGLWAVDLDKQAAADSASGVCSLAQAIRLWTWTLEHLQKATDPEGRKLYHPKRQGVTFPLADALCWILSAYLFEQDVRELKARGPENPVVAEGLPGLAAFYTDLAHMQCARAAAEMAKVCAELVFGYVAHADCVGGACGIGAAHAAPAALAEFAALRSSLDACLAGARLAKDRAAEHLAHVMIPEALDYPM